MQQTRGSSGESGALGGLLCCCSVCPHVLEKIKIKSYDLNSWHQCASLAEGTALSLYTNAHLPVFGDRLRIRCLFL